MVLYSFRDFKAQTAAVHTRLDEMKHRWECLQATLDSYCCFLLQRYLENTSQKPFQNHINYYHNFLIMWHIFCRLFQLLKINKLQWIIWKCIVTMLKTGLSFRWWMTKLTHSDMSPKPRLRHGSGFFLKLRLLAKKKRSAHRTSKKIRQTDHKGRAKGKVSKNRVKNTWGGGGGGGGGGDNGHRCNTSGQGRQSLWWETHQDRKYWTENTRKRDVNLTRRDTEQSCFGDVYKTKRTR